MRSLLICLVLVAIAAVPAAACGSSGAGDNKPQAQPAEPSPIKDDRDPPTLKVTDGVRQFELQPTREFGGLCAYTTPSFVEPNGGFAEHPGLSDECSLEVEGAKAWIVFGGPNDLSVEWAAVLGLAELEVERIVLVLADGSKQELPLRPWPETPFQWFRRGFDRRPFPDILLAYGSGERLLARIDLANRIRTDCLIPEICVRTKSEFERGNWLDAAGEDFDQTTFNFWHGDARRTFDLVMNDRGLRVLLGEGEFWVEELGTWSTCDWTGQLGTWARVRLAGHKTIEADWPFVRLTPAGDGYVRTSAHRKGRVRTLLVLVDLDGATIVTVDPLHESTWEPWFSDARIESTTFDPGPAWKGQKTCADE